MSIAKNKSLLQSILITAIITSIVAVLWLFGNDSFALILNLTVPNDATFPVWKFLIMLCIACILGVLTDKHGLHRIFPIALAFVSIWLLVGVITAKFFELGLAVVPIICVSILSMLAIHFRNLWQIDRDLTEKLDFLASTGHLLEGKSADLRVESGFKLLETIFPVSEIIYFRYESEGNLKPVGRQRIDKEISTLNSRQDSWHICIELCEKALETHQTEIKIDNIFEDAAKIALPLIIDKDIIGVLFIDVREDFENGDINLLESFSQQIARTFKRKELRGKRPPRNTWWNPFSTYSLENRLDTTSLVHGIIREQTLSAVAGSYLNEAHAIAYLDGTLAFVNRRMKELAKLASNEIPDTDLFRLLGRFQTDVFNNPSLAIRRVMQTGDSFNCELDFPDDLKTLKMQINLVNVPVKKVAIHDSNMQTNHSCLLITFSDISAIKENEKLRGDIAHLMSHELRTPITSIQGFAEILLLEDNLPEDSREYLNTIATESQRVSKTLSNFLSVANLQQSDKQEVIKTSVEVNSVVHEVVTEFSKQAKQKRIRIVEKQSTEKSAIAADRGLITKAISQLLDNAIRYSPERTSVMISTFLETDFLRVEVEDRGYGIPKGEEDKIWQKFYRVIHEGQEKQEDTTGLGLSLVKEIVEQHNGEVGLQSAAGRGSKFSFKLPRL